jgi:hemolysin III
MPKFTANELTNAITHTVGAALAIAALVLLVVFTAQTGSARQIVGATIFGSSLILLYTASALYHFFPTASRAKNIFKILDHSMIYVLIAGTYTAVTMALPARGWGWSLFGVSWGLAALGIVLQSVQIKTPHWVQVLHYLVMGWLVVIAAGPLLHYFSPASLGWLFLGGACYTVGVIFYALDFKFPRYSWLSFHGIFHVFVLAGSFAHFWLALRYLPHI